MKLVKSLLIGAVALFSFQAVQAQERISEKEVKDAVKELRIALELSEEQAVHVERIIFEGIHEADKVRQTSDEAAVEDQINAIKKRKEAEMLQLFSEGQLQKYEEVKAAEMRKRAGR